VCFQRLLRELVSAVAVLSERGVVHADLKPENVLLVVSEGGTHV
jgi:serine/threonine protein kinase